LGARIHEVATRHDIAARDGLGPWRGWVVSTVQPVRGTAQGRNQERTEAAIRNLRSQIESPSASVGP
jgi:hypothetical protein